jgi:uncharacterized membrane protein
MVESTGVFVLTLLSALGCGVFAGVFFAFSTFVMPGLSRLPADQGAAAMQAINAAAISPVFLSAFLGTAGACAVLAGYSVWAWRTPAAPYLLGGSVLYLAGSFLVTVVFNVPRNEALAKSGAGRAAMWPDYAAIWTRWNHVRAVASAAASALLTVAL